MTYRKIIIIAGISGMLSVALGAFGAHALEEVLRPEQLSAYKTGISYQFTHTLLLLFLGVLMKNEKSKLLIYSSWFCIIGIICFSGSLYLLSCKDILGSAWLSIMGPITPIGGLFFILSWLFLAYNYLKK